MSEIDIKARKDNHDYFTPEHIAQFLRNNNTGVNNRGRQFLATIISHYNNPSVLDAACGTCVNWEVFKAMGIKCRYTGMDRTKGMLREAKNRYGDKIELVEGYVQDLPFSDDTKDIVIMRHILEHLPDGYEQAIKEGFRVALQELILVFFLVPHQESDQIQESQPDEFGCTYFMNTYNHNKLMAFLSTFGCRIVTDFVQTQGAAHPDFIIRLIK